MRSLAEQLREAARAALPEGAFLRRDRGEALFVSDAPRLRPPADWLPALEPAGFLCEVRGGLLYLTPGPAWLAGLEARFPEPPDAFSASLARFRGMTPENESLALFALAIRRMDGEADGGRFERRLRQRAAECLRLTAADKTTTPGGGLYACALARYMTMEAIP